MKKRLLKCMLKKLVDCRTLTIVILALFSLQTYAAKANNDAQNVKISINLKKASLPAVLNAIEKESGYHVLYNNTQSSVVDNITVKCIDKKVSDVLDEIFVGTELTYSFDNNVIIISNKIPQPQPKAKVITVKGKVIEKETKNAVPGATIIVQNTTKGAITDDKGMFSLSANVGDVLTVSYVGLKETEYKVVDTDKDVIIAMDKSGVDIDEVVVTGYQSVKKSRMTGSVETITSKDITNKGFTSVGDILKGQMAGVSTMSISGRPGASSEIRIRGINSLTGSSDPIWIVDGMPLQGDVPNISMGGTEFQETVLTNGIGNIPPDDIESITVLKDAAATAIYGSRAANGVIVITTKRGSVGKSTIRVSTSYAVGEAPKNRLTMMNATQKIAFERSIYEDFPGAGVNGRVFQLLKNADYGVITREAAEKEITRLGKINTDWFDEIFRISQSQNHSVTLSGGDEKTQYYASLSYLGQQGIVPNNYYESMGANLKLTHDFNKRLRINLDVRSTVRNDRSTASSVNPLDYATFANPYERVYDENGNYEYDRSYSAGLSYIEDGYEYDFNIIEDLNKNTSRSKYLNNQITLKLELKLIEGLMFSTMGTLSNANTTSTKELTPGTYSSELNAWLTPTFSEKELPDSFNLGQISESNARSESWTVRNQFEYARGFSDGNHYINAYIGQEVSSSKSYGFSSMIPQWDPEYGTATFPDLTGTKVPNQSFLSALSGHTEGQDRSVSFFATATYSYKDKYVFTGSGRLDGADIIGTANRFSPLWNVSLKWNLHNEKFMKGVTVINQLAIRGSYGYTGSIDRNVLPFSLLERRTSAGYNNAVYNGEKIPNVYTPAQPSIKWQRKQDRNIGFDLSMFNNRLNIVANYYNNNVKNLIGDNYVAMSSGYKSLKANLASLNNKGYEFSLKTTNIRTRDFVWTTSFNIAYNKNTVTDTYYKSINDITPNAIMNRSFMNGNYIQGYSQGARFGYKFAGIDPATGDVLAYVDGYSSTTGERLGVLRDGRYVYNMDIVGNPGSSGMPADYAYNARQFIGDTYPPVNGGFNTQFNYKRLSLSATFAFYTGHIIESYRTLYSDNSAYIASNNVLTDEMNRWRKPGDITNVAKYTTQNSARVVYLYDDNFESGNYLKCTNLSFGYNLPQKACEKILLTSARLNFNVSNVFTLTNYRGTDPENRSSFGYPSARVYNISLSVGF